MFNSHGIATSLLIVLAVSWLSLSAPGRETPASVATATPARSSPEMEKLKFYVGEWDYSETYPKSAFFPQGGRNTGVYTSKLGPGGNSLINEFHSRGPVGDFEGLLVMTWDAREGKYKCYVFGGESPGAIVQAGTFEGDALVYRAELSVGPSKMVLRNVTRITAPGELISEEYSSSGGAPEVLLVTVVATKRRPAAASARE